MSRKRKKKAKSPEIFQSLSKPPDGSWAQRSSYHGARILLIVLLAGGVTALFPRAEQGPPELPQPGSVAPADVAAEVGFMVPRDSTELEADRAEIAAAVAPIFRENAGTQLRLETEFAGFFERIEAAVE
ncbi:MAG: hypothetical protein HKO65_09640, partial [Gemmatimonadetes bacterium]|nr:hypothetical protein [Gemmatimonadota bacterium]